MEKYLSSLQTLPLFRGIAPPDILRLLHSLGASEQHFASPEILWEPTSQLPYMGIITEGSFQIMQEDWRGNRSITGSFLPGDFISERSFGEMDGLLPFHLSVKAGTTVIHLAKQAGVDPPDDLRDIHMIFLRNLVDALIQKELQLLYKIEYLSKRTTREKLMSYFTVLSARQHSSVIHLDFNRQELADFLSVDRSAMCTELARMQNDGLIRYDKRQFELLLDEPVLISAFA